MYDYQLRDHFDMFNMISHMSNHIKPQDWFNHKSRKFKKNKRKGK